MLTCFVSNWNNLYVFYFFKPLIFYCGLVDPMASTAQPGHTIQDLGSHLCMILPSCLSVELILMGVYCYCLFADKMRWDRLLGSTDQNSDRQPWRQADLGMYGSDRLQQNVRGCKPAGVISSVVGNEPIKGSGCLQSSHSRDEGVSK